MPVETVIDVVLDRLRIAALAETMLDRISPDERPALANQLRFFERKLADDIERMGLRIRRLDGQAYDPGMAATGLNSADFEPGAALVVAETIAPVVLDATGVLRRGVVMLKRLVE